MKNKLIKFLSTALWAIGLKGLSWKIYIQTRRQNKKTNRKSDKIHPHWRAWMPRKKQ